MKRTGFVLLFCFVFAWYYAEAQPTAALLAERVSWNLCMNESNGRWMNTVRFSGPVDVVYSSGVPPWIHDLVGRLIPRVNAVISPAASLRDSTTAPTRNRITVLYGESGFAWLKGRGFVSGSSDRYKGYNYFWAVGGRITEAYVWYGTNASRGTVAQELTQVLGACADWPDAPETALWRDECTVEWLDDAELGALFYLYHRLRGGESRDQVYREVLAMAGG